MNPHIEQLLTTLAEMKIMGADVADDVEALKTVMVTQSDRNALWNLVPLFRTVSVDLLNAHADMRQLLILWDREFESPNREML